MKKAWIAIGIIAILIISSPFIFIYFLNNGNPYTKYLVNKHIPNHLEEKGYTDHDFETAHYVEPKHMIDGDFYQGHYMVVFKDEPEMTYYYGIKKKDKTVSQFCEKEELLDDGVSELVTRETKHSEAECGKAL